MDFFKKICKEIKKRKTIRGSVDVWKNILEVIEEEG
jgi:hypothetical protein